MRDHLFGECHINFKASTLSRTIVRLSILKPIVALLIGSPFLLSAQSPTQNGTPAGNISRDTTRIITLDEAVRLAQRSAPATVQARGQLSTSAEALRAARAAFIPSLDLSASRTYQGGDILGQTGTILSYSGRSWRSGDALNTNVILFAGGQRLYAMRGARAGIAVAQANNVTQQFTVAFQVKQGYFDALAARESEAAALAQLQEAQEQARVANAQVALGVSTISDSLRASVQVINAQVALLTARNDLAAANALLTRLTASPGPVTADPADTLLTGIVPLDSVALVGLAEGGPTVQQAVAQQASANASVGAAHSAYFPQISASASLNGNGFDPYYGVGDPYAYGQSFRLTLSYPIFDQLQRQQSSLSAIVAKNNADAALRDARLSARQQAVQLIGTLHLNAEQLTLEQLSLRAAEEDLRVVQQRYGLHDATLLDVLTSQTALTTARMALIQSRYTYRVTKAQLETLVGRSL
jgi:outer membrane protein